MNGIKTRFEVIKNEADSKVTDMYLYGRIGDPILNKDEETITVKDVREKLNKITTDKIVVHLNSGGGCMFSSIAIHNLFKSHKATIEMVIDSLAGSGGSVISMAGDKIKMYKNAMLFIHPAHTITYDSAKGHRKVADDLDKMDKSLKESYSERFTGTDEELEDLIQNATWLTAQEAKELGFCDEIIESDSSSNVSNKINNDISLEKFINNRKQSKTVAELMKKYSNKTNSKINNKTNSKTLLDNFKGGTK